MKKILLLFSFLFIIILVGCNSIIASYTLESKNIWREYRQYSPDGKNYIREVLNDSEQSSEPDSYKVKAYLNDSDKVIATKSLVNTNPDKINCGNDGMWINNNEVVINGKFILNIKTNSKKQINFSDVKAGTVLSIVDALPEPKNKIYIHNYSISKNKDKVGYIFVGNFHEYIYTYEIKAKKWELVKSFRFHHTIPVSYNISWDADNNLFFDTADTTPPAGDKSLTYYIYKFDSVTKSVSSYLKGYSLETVSMNSGCLVAHIDSPIKRASVVLDINSKAEILEFKDSIFNFSSDGKTLAYYEDKKIVIFNVETWKAQSSIGLRGLLVKGLVLKEIDYYKDKCFFYLGKSSSFKEDLYYITTTANSDATDKYTKDLTNAITTSVNDDIFYNGDASDYKALENNKSQVEIYRDEDEVFFLISKKMKFGDNSKYVAIGLGYDDDKELKNEIDTRFSRSNIKSLKKELSGYKYFKTVEISFAEAQTPQYGNISDSKKAVINNIRKDLPKAIKNSSIRIQKGEYAVSIRNYRENDHITYAVLSQDSMPVYVFSFQIELNNKVKPYREYQVSYDPVNTGSVLPKPKGLKYPSIPVYTANQYLKSAFYSTTYIDVK